MASSFNLLDDTLTHQSKNSGGSRLPVASNGTSYETVPQTCTKNSDALDDKPQIEISTFAQGVTPYKPVSSQERIQSSSLKERPFKLDWNEATIQPSPKVQAAISNHLAHGPGLNWYPEVESHSLLKALESYTKLPSDYMIATSGSDDALSLLCTCYINPNDEVLVPVPTYNHFVVFAQAHGAKIVQVQPDNPFEANLDGIREKLNNHTRIAYLISPNNPTGTIVPNDAISEFCTNFPETLFILDEAYFEFSQITGIHLVKEFKNLIVTRTFSKAFGLAGLRVGYLCAHPSLLKGIKRLYNPKSVNSLAQIGAKAALDDLDYLNAFLDEVKQSKILYQNFFDTCSYFEATITPANFIVLKCENPNQTLRALESRNIYVRDRSNYPGMKNCLRMSIGNVEQTKEVIERLRDLFC